MKIGIYTPYLDTLGGGEKYMLTIGETLSSVAKVDVILGTHLYQLNINEFKDKIIKLHNINLSKINIIKGPFGKGSNAIERMFFLRKYNYFFYLTDGSIFFSTAKENIIHFQVPFENDFRNIWTRIKYSSWDLAIYNSNFTKSIVEKNWMLKGRVVYPPVSIEGLKPLKKKKQIISVGRFFGYLRDKKHELMIDIFKKMIKEKDIEGWSLLLVGAAGEGDRDYINQLKEKARDYPIFILPNLSFSELKEKYGESSIYWHVMGYGENDPKKFEHFGITIVEAMASGCVPIVINKGGLKEIVDQNVNGFLWDELTEMMDYTKKVASDDKLREKLSKEATKKSQKFSKQEFCDEIRRIVEADND